MTRPINITVTPIAETPTVKRSGILKRFITPLTLLACIAAVLLISKFFLIHESLRLDEAQSIWQTAHSLSGTLQVVAQDVHMPLYHILLHYWMILFGTGVETVRTMSLLFFVISIPSMYLLARTILSRPWALTVTALFSLSPFMNWYANEARMYTLLALFSILNQYFFTRIVQKRKGWLGYLLTAVIGIFSHYFFAFNLLTQAIFYIFNHRKFAKGSLKRFIGVAIAVIAAAAPWIAYFISQGSASNTRPLLQAPTTVNFFNVFSQFIFGFQTDPVNTVLVSCWPLLVIVAFFTVKKHLKFKPDVLYMLCAAFIPVLLAFVLSFVVTPFFLSRYMLPAVAPLFVAIMWLLSQYSKKVIIIGITLWAGILGYAFYLQTTSFLNPARENYHAAVEYIDAHATGSDIVTLSSPFTVYPVEYYHQGPAEIKTIPLWDRQNVGTLPAFDKATLPQQVTELTEGHDNIYLLLSYDQGYEKDIYNYFNDHFERVSTKEFSDKMTLYVYRVGYRETPKLADAAL
jgi:mannosyltransferase